LRSDGFSSTNCHPSRAVTAESATARDKRGSRWCEDTTAPFERLEYTTPNVSCRFGRFRTGRRLLHHNGAQIRERERSFQEGKHLFMALLGPKAIDEDIPVEHSETSEEVSRSTGKAAAAFDDLSRGITGQE
jgi:hypothetical protein